MSAPRPPIDTADQRLAETSGGWLPPIGPSASTSSARTRGAKPGPDSDYDVMVVVPDSAPPERRRSRLAYQALRGSGLAADVLVCTREYFESRLHILPSLPATIAREGRQLYAA